MKKNRLISFCMVVSFLMSAVVAPMVSLAEEELPEVDVAVQEVIAESTPAVELEVTTEPVLVVEPEVTAVPVVEPEVTAVPVVEPEATAVPVVEPEVTALPVVESEATAVPVVEPEVTVEPEVMEEIIVFEIVDDKLVAYHGDEETVVIPDEVRVIEEKAFYQNMTVKKVVMKNVEEIKDFAFAGCEKLQKVVFDKGKLKQIGAHAFDECERLDLSELFPVEVINEQLEAAGVTETIVTSEALEEQPEATEVTETPVTSEALEEQPEATEVTETPVTSEESEEQPEATGVTETLMALEASEEQREIAMGELTVYLTAAWSAAPIVTGVAQNTDIVLTWTGASSTYYIYEVVNGSKSRIAMTDTKTYTISNPSIGVHSYLVRPREKVDGVWAVGNFSEQVDVEVVECVWNTAPIVTRQEFINNMIELEWTGIASSYYIYEVVGSTKNKIATVSENKYSIEGASVGSHSYMIRPREKVDGVWRVGEFSDVATVEVTGSVFTWSDAPVFTRAEYMDGKVQLEWEGYASTYYVYEVIGSTKARIATVSESNYTIESASIGTHNYLVRPRERVDGAWLVGDFSEQASVEVIEIVHTWNEAPVVTRTECVDNQVVLEWTGCASTYYVYEVTGSTKVRIATVEEPSYTIDDVTVGTHTYLIRPRERVEGIWLVGEFSEPTSVEVTELVHTWSEAPVITRNEYADNQIVLEWTGYASTYYVYEVVGSTKTRIATVEEPSYMIEDVTVGTHTYLIRPRERVEGLWLVGEFSEPTSVEVTELVHTWDEAPVITRSEYADNQIVLEWTGYASTYYVYEVVGSTKTRIATVEEPSYTLEDVTVGTHTYLIRPRERVEGLWLVGEFSEPTSVEVTELVHTWDEAPVITRSEYADNQIVLEWTGYASTYYVYEAVGSTKTRIATVEESSYTIEDVTAGTHTYLIRPRERVENSWFVGEFSEPVSVEVIILVHTWDEAPVITRSEYADNQVVLEWTGYASTYYVYEIIGSTKTRVATVEEPACTLANVSEGSHTYVIRPREKVDGIWQVGLFSEESTVVATAPEFKINDVKYRLIGNVLTVVAYEGTASHVSIEETISGMTVRAIGDEAFMGNTSLTSITLPDTIETIGVRAFANCVNLSTMD